MVRRAGWMAGGGWEALRGGAASEAMRLGPTVMLWRSLAKMRGVARVPISCAGCQGVLAVRACQVESDGRRRSVLSAAVMRREAAKPAGTAVAGWRAWGEVTLTRISLSPGLRRGVISSQSKAPKSLGRQGGVPLTVATKWPTARMWRLARVGAASRWRV